MGSLRISFTWPEIYESRKQRRHSHSWNSEPSAVDLVGFSSWLPHLDIKLVGNRKKAAADVAVRCSGLLAGPGMMKASEALVSGARVSFLANVASLGPRRNARCKQIVVYGLEGVEENPSVSRSVVNSPSSQFDGVSLGGAYLAERNSAPTSVSTSDRNSLGQKCGKRIWNKFMGIKKAAGRKVTGTASRRKQWVSRKISGKKFDLAVSAVGPNSSVEHCNSVLKLLDRYSEDKTIEFFEWMKSNGKLKRNNDAYQLVLRALARKEDWCRAGTLLEEMASTSDCSLNVQLFNALIYVCNKRGLVRWGTKWFQVMLEKEVQPNIATIGMLMSLYQNSANLLQAEFTFNHMRSLKLQCLSAYSAMITIYTRLGLYSKSEEVINLMEGDKILPNLENWLVRLNAYSQQSKMDEAELVVKMILGAGFSPNIVAYNTLITGYGKAARTEDAERLFLSLESVGLKPDETTYRSIIEGFGRTSNYEKTLQYYEKLKVSGFKPSSSNFYTIINLQAKHRDETGAIQTLKDMRKEGCQCSSILSSLLQAYERVGMVEKVPFILKLSFYEEILLDPTSCSLLLMSYVQNLMLDDALRVLKEKRWKDSEFESNLYHLLICSCKEEGHFESAVKVYLQMTESEISPNLYITCSMIDIYSAIGRFKDAEDLYLKLHDSGSTFDMITYSIVVRMYIKSGSLEAACMVLEKMEEQKDIVPDTYLFRDMLRTYQQCGLTEKLASVYYWMLKIGVIWDEAMYNCVINCCGHALPIDELSRLFDEMMQCGYTANTITLNVLLDAYGKAGLFKKARKVFWLACKHDLADVISYNTLIAAYGKSKDFKNMKSLVKKMQQAGYLVSLEAYNCMLDAYGKENLMEEFNEVLKKMREATCVSDHYTYNIMINIYGRKGWIGEVATVLDELRKHGMEPDLYSYNTLIKAYGFAGLVEEAVNVVQEMRKKGIKPDRITYANLITALQRNENFLEAVKWSLWMKQIEHQVELCPS